MYLPLFGHVGGLVGCVGGCVDIFLGVGVGLCGVVGPFAAQAKISEIVISVKRINPTTLSFRISIFMNFKKLF